MNGALEKQVVSLGVAGEVPVFMRKGPPRHKEMDGYFKTRGLHAQPQAIMGSGLVGHRGDSGRMVLRDVEER